MDITVYKQSYNTFGGSPLYSPISDLLTANLGDYGPGVQSLVITACLASRTRQFLPTLEDIFDRFHAHLEKLPKVTFRRAKNRLELIFRSQHFFADDDAGPCTSVDKLHSAAIEVAEALPLLRKKCKPTDPFDLDGFLADATQLLKIKVDSMEAWAHVRDQAKARRMAALSAKDPWEQLEIDWTRYHPKAREILDDTFFWEGADDTAPHGNDTGSDLLEDFLRWNQRNKAVSPLSFLDKLLNGWGIRQIDWLVTEPAEVRKQNQEDPIVQTVCNESIIALAFAVLKTRADCPPDVIQMAIAGLERTSILVKDSKLKEEVKAEWFEAIATMTRKLTTIANKS